jgi:5-enolpyruvylshikimate-3-phosphate synthase
MATIAIGLTTFLIDDTSKRDNIAQLSENLNNIGITTTIIADKFLVKPSETIRGGSIVTEGDYPLILACLLASTHAKDDIIISHKDTLKKAHPNLWQKLKEHSFLK